MVSIAGNEMTIDWSLYFDPAVFGGTHSVFFDAKGGPGSPEPRLGWTRMGTWTVPTVSADAGNNPDAQIPNDAQTDAALRPRDVGESGCDCRVTNGSSPHLWWAPVLVIGVMGRYRRR